MPATETTFPIRDSRPLACLGAVLCLPFYWVVAPAGLPEVRVALVDLLPLVILLAVCTGRCKLRIDRRIAVALTLLAAATVLHSMWTWRFQRELVLGGTIKETIKLLSSAALLLSFAPFFSEQVLRQVRVWHLVAINAAFSVLAHTFQHLKLNGLDPSETLIGCYLVLAYLLLLRRLVCEERIGPATAGVYVLLGLAHMRVLHDYQTVALYATAVAGIASVVFLPVFRPGRPRMFYRAAVATAGIVTLATACSPAALFNWCLGNGDSTSRAVMWQIALQSIGEHFPAGIGLGQTPQGFLEQMRARGWSNTTIHNSLLSLLVQLGLLGVGWIALGGVLVWNAVSRLPFVVAANYLLIVAVAVGLNDAWGMRSVLILMSFGAAGWIELIPARAAQPARISETRLTDQLAAQT